jgi:hypothetical protein
LSEENVLLSEKDGEKITFLGEMLSRCCPQAVNGTAFLLWHHNSHITAKTCDILGDETGFCREQANISNNKISAKRVGWGGERFFRKNV